MKLGVLGGTFDPPHLGHLLLAEEARARLGLSGVVFLLAGQPWLKGDREVSPVSHRLALLRLALAGNPHFHLSALEAQRPGPSYTIDSLPLLKRQWGEPAELYFLLGSDSLEDLPRWHRARELVGMCYWVVLRRPGGPAPDLDSLERALPGLCSRLTLLEGPAVAISSSEIRQRVRQGLSIRYWVPEGVRQYIEEHRLYQ